MAVWDALMKAGVAYGIRPAGMLALDVVRLEAGLILLEVDYTSARHAMNPDQNYSPGEIGLGRLVDLDKADFVGRLALEREAKAGGPARRLVGLQLDWYDIEGLYDAQGLPPRDQPVGRSLAGPRLRRRPTGRPRHQPRLEPDPQAGHRAGVRAAAVRAARLEARRRMDGRGSPRPGRRDRRRAAVPGPAAQAQLRRGPGRRSPVAAATSAGDERHVDDVLGEEPDLELVAAQDVAHQQVVACPSPPISSVVLIAARTLAMIVSWARSVRSIMTATSSAPSGGRGIVVSSAA